MYIKKKQYQSSIFPIKVIHLINKQNEKIISFCELLKKEENKQELEDKENTEDTEMIENSKYILRSFKVNLWLLEEFLRTAKKKDMKVQTATNKAFRMFIEKYD